MSSRRFRNSGRNFCLHFRHHLFAHGFGVLAFLLIDEVLRADVRRQHDQRVLEVDRAALAVRQAAIVQNLQQHVEDVRMRLLDLIEQDDLIRPPANGFRQRATFLVANVARRRADQTSDRVLLHVFRHVDAHQRRVVVEEIAGESLRQLRLADARRA